jgi:hypothetical protein
MTTLINLKPGARFAAAFTLICLLGGLAELVDPQSGGWLLVGSFAGVLAVVSMYLCVLSWPMPLALDRSSGTSTDHTVPAEPWPCAASRLNPVAAPSPVRRHKLDPAAALSLGVAYQANLKRAGAQGRAACMHDMETGTQTKNPCAPGTRASIVWFAAYQKELLDGPVQARARVGEAA